MTLPTPTTEEGRSRKARRIWIASAAGPLTCPDGHRLKDPLVWSHGCIRCNHVSPDQVYADGRGGGRCGKLVYLVGGGLASTSGDPIMVLCEVTPIEMLAMSRGRMDAGQALRFLGILLVS
jgi:hypothetical protein